MMWYDMICDMICDMIWYGRCMAAFIVGFVADLAHRDLILIVILIVIQLKTYKITSRSPCSGLTFWRLLTLVIRRFCYFKHSLHESFLVSRGWPVIVFQLWTECRVTFDNVLQASLLCEPVVGGYGGIPAGCQCDKEGNLYVADMRLGILKVTPTGDFQQVCTSSHVRGCQYVWPVCNLMYVGWIWINAEFSWWVN